MNCLSIPVVTKNYIQSMLLVIMFSVIKLSYCGIYTFSIWLFLSFCVALSEMNMLKFSQLLTQLFIFQKLSVTWKIYTFQGYIHTYILTSHSSLLQQTCQTPIICEALHWVKWQAQRICSLPLGDLQSSKSLEQPWNNFDSEHPIHTSSFVLYWHIFFVIPACHLYMLFLSSYMYGSCHSLIKKKSLFVARTINMRFTLWTIF